MNSSSDSMIRFDLDTHSQKEMGEIMPIIYWNEKDDISGKTWNDLYSEAKSQHVPYYYIVLQIYKSTSSSYGCKFVDGVHYYSLLADIKDNPTLAKKFNNTIVKTKLFFLRCFCINNRMEEVPLHDNELIFTEEPLKKLCVDGSEDKKVLLGLALNWKLEKDLILDSGKFPKVALLQTHVANLFAQIKDTEECLIWLQSAGKDIPRVQENYIKLFNSYASVKNFSLFHNAISKSSKKNNSH